MNKFKVGDKIRRKADFIDKDSGYPVWAYDGGVYTIKSISFQNEEGMIFTVENDPDEITFYGFEWELVEAAQEQPKKYLKWHDIIVAWLGGADVQIKDQDEWHDLTNVKDCIHCSFFHNDREFRLKPKTVTKYQVLFKNKFGVFGLSSSFFSSIEEAKAYYSGAEVIKIVEETAKEFEV